MPEASFLAALFAVLLLFALVGWWWSATRLGRANRARNRRARRAENAAEKLLVKNGYEILERQLHRSWSIEVDGERRAVASRADLLVARSGRVFVADVKTGGEAPDPRRPATRRQLLEYLLVFAADGALVVDMERRRILTVAFPDLTARSSNI